jgi:hypothetical protein
MNEDGGFILPWIPSWQSRNHESAPSWEKYSLQTDHFVTTDGDQS